MYTLIIQRNLFWYLSKKKYKNTEEAVADYPDYMTSLIWDSIDQAINFIKDEWGLSENEVKIFKKFDLDESVEKIVLKGNGGWQFENKD